MCVIDNSVHYENSSEELTSVFSARAVINVWDVVLEAICGLIYSPKWDFPAFLLIPSNKKSVSDIYKSGSSERAWGGWGIISF